MKSFATTAILLCLSGLGVLGNENGECPIEKPVEFDSTQVTVTYSVTAANATDLAALQTELETMLADIQEQEPKTLVAAAYRDEEDMAFHIRETFADAEGLIFHFTNTVAPKFDALTQLGTPSTFFIYGEVSQVVKSSIAASGMTADFATFNKGFERALECCDKVDNSEPQVRFLHGDDGECDPADHVRQVPPLTEGVTVFYKVLVTADNEAQIKATYDKVLPIQEEDEPGTLAVRLYDGEDGSFHIRNDFLDTNAATVHLTTTVANELQVLLGAAEIEIFIVHYGGDVDDISTYTAVAESLGIPYHSGQFVFGFSRDQECCPAEEIGDKDSAATNLVAMPWTASLLVFVLASIIAF